MSVMRPLYHLILASTLLCFANASAEEPFALTLRDAQDQIETALMDEGAGNAIEATITGKNEAIVHQAAKPVRMEIRHIDYDNRTFRWEAELAFYEGDKIAKNDIWTGRFVALVEIPVPARRIFGGEIIKRSDLVLTEVAEHRLRHNSIFSMNQLVGQSAKRILREGQPVADHEIEAPVVAERGDTLQVTYRTEHMEIRTLGEALEDAPLGKRISVRNLDSGAVLRAVVTAPGIAEVNDFMQISQNQGQ